MDGVARAFNMACVWHALEQLSTRSSKLALSAHHPLYRFSRPIRHSGSLVGCEDLQKTIYAFLPEHGLRRHCIDDCRRGTRLA